MSTSTRLISRISTGRGERLNARTPIMPAIPRLAKKAMLPIREPVITSAITMIAR